MKPSPIDVRDIQIQQNSRCVLSGVVELKVQLSIPQCKEIWDLYLEMSTDPKRVDAHFKNLAEKKENRYEDLVFDKTTLKLIVKKKAEVTADDRKVYPEMTKFFNLLVWEDVEKGED